MSKNEYDVHFLLVDDREQNLVALEALLRREGLVLHKAHSGREALELLLEHDVALALIDVQMPDMDGFELAELMRGSERTRNVPIIFLTAGRADEQRRFRGYEAGAVDFIHKPIEADILKSKVAVFFDLYRQRQEVAHQRDELAAVIEQNERLLEETRRSAQELEAADRRKNEFLATLAHELRNPLAPIRNGLDLMKLVMDEPATLEEIRNTMERQTEQLITLVDDLLDVSRITRGKFELRKRPVQVADVVESAVEASQPFIEEAGHELTINVPDFPIYLDADPHRLAQVLSNLLNNAAKYTPEGGRIWLSGELQGTEVLLAVKDTGIGIHAEMRERIFEMFAQIDRPVEKGYTGLGIGLTLVKSLVEMHGGRIEVHSEGPNRGSEFCVHLPILNEIPRGERHSGPSDQLETSHHSFRVLVVDDNEAAANMLSMLVKMLGHEAHRAGDGQQAVQMASELLPEIVLMDLGMPRMDGYEAARRIRQSPWGEKIMLVALTGWGQPEDKQRTKEAGFDHHLVKPVEPSELKRLFQE